MRAAKAGLDLAWPGYLGNGGCPLASANATVSRLRSAESAKETSSERIRVISSLLSAREDGRDGPTRGADRTRRTAPTQVLCEHMEPDELGVVADATHRVACVERREVTDAADIGHVHVIALGVEDADGTVARLGVIGAIDGVRQGQRFVVLDPQSGQEVTVEPAVCGVCRTATLTAIPTTGPGPDVLLMMGSCDGWPGPRDQG